MIESSYKYFFLQKLSLNLETIGQLYSYFFYKIVVSRTDKKLNSSLRTAKDSQGRLRTCQVLNQSLNMPLLALEVLDQSLTVVGNPADTLPRTGRRNNPKPFQDLWVLD